jgi:hypothetical protein
MLCVCIIFIYIYIYIYLYTYIYIWYVYIYNTLLIYILYIYIDYQRIYTVPYTVSRCCKRHLGGSLDPHRAKRDTQRPAAKQAAASSGSRQGHVICDWVLSNHKEAQDVGCPMWSFILPKKVDLDFPDSSGDRRCIRQDGATCLANIRSLSVPWTWTLHHLRNYIVLVPKPVEVSRNQYICTFQINGLLNDTIA